MRLAVQYLTDGAGNKQAVQLPLSEWKKLMNRLKKYEQTLKLKSDLQEAFDQAAQMKRSKTKNRHLSSGRNAKMPFCWRPKASVMISVVALGKGTRSAYFLNQRQIPES